MENSNNSEAIECTASYKQLSATIPLFGDIRGKNNKRQQREIPYVL